MLRQSSTDYRINGVRNTHWIGSWVGPKTSCAIWRRENLFAPCRDHDVSVVHAGPSSLDIYIYIYIYIYIRTCQCTLFWDRLFQSASHILLLCTIFSIIVLLMYIPCQFPLLMQSEPVVSGPPVARGGYSKRGNVRKHLIPPAKPN